ncbi:twin-arginine translocation pathway signal [Mycobacterium sp. 1423905.2]|uniref:twin-arginine translocation pathway signal n=1 Tax=Mycobacterium sp. 1423905.2 TaxID=1856859 RepID=UPI000B263A92|nr:twin-arginine translocation pathway signal [Mycobacterium sp. 1423905.2]
MSAEEASIVDETEKVDQAAPAEDVAAADETSESESADRVEEDDPRPSRRKRFAARAKALSSGRLPVILVALSLVGSLALLGSLLYFTYLPDRRVNDAAAKVAIAAASEGTVAVLSYAPETLDQDFATARSHLTGDFLSYYDQFTQQIVAPAAKMKSVKTTAVVLRAALSEFHPDSAVVLLFVNQTTQSKDRPEPTLASSSVEVKLTKADKKWLISSFNPI